MPDRKIIFDAVKVLRGGQAYTQADVAVLDTAIDSFVASLPEVQQHAARTALAPVEPPKPKFALSEASMKKLGPVRPQLRACVELAITLSLVDFRVQQSLRSIEDQQAAVAAGNSRTMKSKHLRQADGSVWAVDLVALVNGQVSWEMPLYAAIAFAMDQAATQLGYASHVRWGCAWDRVLSDFGGDSKAYMNEVKAYAARHPGSDLLDGPHFEWVQ